MCVLWIFTFHVEYDLHRICKGILCPCCCAPDFPDSFPFRKASDDVIAVLNSFHYLVMCLYAPIQLQSLSFSLIFQCQLPLLGGAVKIIPLECISARPAQFIFAWTSWGDRNCLQVCVPGGRYLMMYSAPMIPSKWDLIVLLMVDTKRVPFASRRDDADCRILSTSVTCSKTSRIHITSNFNSPILRSSSIDVPAL